MLQKLTRTLLFLLIISFFASCKNGGKQESDKASKINPELIAIQNLEKDLKAMNNKTDATPIAKKLEKGLLLYATKNKQDSLAPKFVYKAARLNEIYFDNYAEAFSHYNSVVVDFDESRFTPVAMFKRGLLMETYFKKSDKAIFYLDEFIKKYPDHKMSEMAMQIITTSGVDADALFERINQKPVE